MKKLHKNFLSMKQTVETMACQCLCYCNCGTACNCPDIPAAAGMNIPSIMANLFGFGFNANGQATMG